MRKIAIMSHDNLATKRLTRDLKKLDRKTQLDKLIYERRDNSLDQVGFIKAHTPKHTKLKDEQGRQVHDRLRAKTFADYYEHKHWAIDQDEREYISEESILPMSTEVEAGEIPMKELDEAMKKLKNNKAPGPDEIPAEVFKWLDGESRKVILETLNECWRNETLIEGMNDARLAIIYKKGGTDLPQNYRPIALLNVIYKLLASIIQARLSSKMDVTLDENPFGFRKGKSTAQPLFILRRTQEIQEEAALECHLLLDLEKAFDKVLQDRMTKAIKRFGVPNKIIHMMSAIYKEPNYAIVEKETPTDPRLQKAGIRQGCPLSPYLFIMLMTVIMYDVQEGLTEHEKEIVERSKLHKQGSGKLFYADDTIIMAKTAEAVEAILHRIEEKSYKYALKLNQNKCIHIHTNAIHRIHFRQGNAAPIQTQGDYLGGDVKNTGDHKPELQHRITVTWATVRRLDMLWGRSRASIEMEIKSTRSNYCGKTYVWAITDTTFKSWCKQAGCIPNERSEKNIENQTPVLVQGI